MNFLNFFGGGRSTQKSAGQAKERLQLIIAHESAGQSPDFLPKLMDELKAVISRYMPLDEDTVNVKVEKSGDIAVLELNVVLDSAKKSAK